MTIRIYHQALRAVLGLSALCLGCLSLSRPVTARYEGTGPSGTTSLYLPLLRKPPKLTPQVNAPYFPGVFDWNQTAVTWFGRVTPSENYADVRVGYAPDRLHIRLNIFDRLLWFDQTPTPATLTDWDAASVYLDTDGTSGTSPDQPSFLFTGQLNKTQNDEPWTASSQGNGSGWSSATVPFTMFNDWRGNTPNDLIDDRGWLITFEIPFSSLGLPSAPAEGTSWGLGLRLYDRDSETGASLTPKNWPVDLDPNNPSTWGLLRFGIPAYTPPPVSQTSSLQIRHGLPGASVSDAHVGGAFQCGKPYFPDFFNGWGDANHSGDHKINVQNQHDVSDWPCFSKSLLTFSLNQIPPGKVIVSASLQIHQQGNSGQAQPNPIPASYVQVIASTEGWSEATVTWNNTPTSWQNYGGIWVEPMDTSVPQPPPPVPWEWDVSQLVADAYEGGLPARIVLYSADSPQHTGKYFLSSESGNANPELRPTLTVSWGDP